MNYRTPFLFIAVRSQVTMNAGLTEADTIVLVAQVNEDIECSIRDNLQIRATVTDNMERAIASRNVSFTNDPIFIPVPTGNYACSIEIVTPNNITLDTRRILCATTNVTSQLFLIVVISLSGSTLVALIVGFASGVLALQCWIKRRKQKGMESKKLSDATEKLSRSKDKVPDPHYEELPKPTRNSIPLETNVAYGQNSIGRHSLAVSCSSESHTLV